MPKNDTLPKSLKKRELVRAAVDLKGVPEGTSGTIILSNGLDWIRYWVAFENGIELGSLHRDKLVRASEWEEYLIKNGVNVQYIEDICRPFTQFDKSTKISEFPYRNSNEKLVDHHGNWVDQVV